MNGEVDLEAVAAEVRAALDVDETRMGDVWRGVAAGKSPEAIAAELGTQTSNFVRKYMRFARAIELGDLPDSPTLVRECGTATAGFLRRHQGRLSNGAQAVLRERVETLRESATRLVETGAEQIEDAAVQEKTLEVERAGIPGIYVYTLPHYYRNPMLPSSGERFEDRTLMKVGKSDNDVIRRFREQVRTTALPEDPWLLRTYTGGSDMAATETEFFKLLRAADHRPVGGRAAGTEWFLTSLKFLDAIAEAFGLTLHYAIEDAVQN